MHILPRPKAHATKHGPDPRYPRDVRCSLKADSHHHVGMIHDRCCTRHAGRVPPAAAVSQYAKKSIYTLNPISWVLISPTNTTITNVRHVRSQHSVAGGILRNLLLPSERRPCMGMLCFASLTHCGKLRTRPYYLIYIITRKYTTSPPIRLCLGLNC